MRTDQTSWRRLAGALTLAFFFAGPMIACAEEAQSMGRDYERGGESAVAFNGSKGFDAVVVRPTTFFTSLVSGAVFLVSLPFTAFDPAIGAEKVRENLVDYPFNDTFRRPLGDMDAMGNPAIDAGRE